MMLSFLTCAWKPDSEWESCDGAAATSRRASASERREMQLPDTLIHREKEIKAWGALSLVICMMGIKASKGGKSSGGRIG